MGEKGLGRVLGGAAPVFNLRDATVRDVPALAALIRTAFRDVAERFGLTAENCPKHPSNCEPAWVDRALGQGVRYFVAEADGKLIGCVALERAGDEACYLERLAVLPELRNQGVGTELTRRVLDVARTLRVSRVEIGVIAAHGELVAWYEGRGFEPGRTARFPHLPFEVLFMAAQV